MLIDGLPQLIVRPKSYEELLARPAFVADLDKSKDGLRQVLSDYHFAQLARCGLRGCKTPHFHGFLVLTDAGHETNVGHVCGRRAFGTDFDIKARDYERQRDRQDLLDRAALIVEQAHDVRARITALNNAQFGIKWVREVRAALKATIGDDLVESLRVAQRQENLDVSRVRERSAAEVDQIVERTRQRREQVRYETIRIGRLQPMPWLTFDFEKRLRDELLVPLDQFVSLRHQDLPTPRLRKLVKVFDGWQRTVDEATEASASAIRFLERENLQLLCGWVPEQMVSRSRALQQWIDSKVCASLSLGRKP